MANDQIERVDGTIGYATVGKIFLIAGIVGGLISGVIYVLANLATMTAGDAIIVVLAAPILQGLTLLVYSIVGYPIYKLLAQRRNLGLHQLTVKK